MKLIAKLTPAQRATLTSIHDEIISLWRKRLELARDLSSKMTRYAELIGRIPELEAAADGGSIEASRELLAIKDQIERLVVAIERHENGIVSEFLQEVNSASAQTLATIKEITRPLVKEHLEQLTNLLSPYCEFRHHAKGIAEQTHSYNSAAFLWGQSK